MNSLAVFKALCSWKIDDMGEAIDDYIYNNNRRSLETALRSPNYERV